MSLPATVELRLEEAEGVAQPIRTPICSKKRYSLLLVPFELAALTAAWHLTIEVRILLNPLMMVHLKREELRVLAPPLGAVLLLWILVVLWLRVYRQELPRFGVVGVASVLKSAIVAGTLVIVVTFFSREFGASLSRSFVLLFVPVSFVMLSAGRFTALLAAALLEKKWPAVERVAIMGQSPEVRRVLDSMRGAGDGSLTVVGVILPPGASARGLGNPVPVLGTTRELGEVINRERLDRIVLLEDGPLAKQDLDECARISKRMDVVLSRVISAPDREARMEFTAFRGLNLLDLKPVYFTRKQELIKRAFDIVASASCLVFLAPVLAVFALLVKLTSKGPVLYQSRRVGRGGRHFIFLKFRSMYVGSEDRSDLTEQNEQSGHLFKMRNDPRVTPLGRFMRRYSIDELPQLLNVLLGDMSLVGPRPLPAQDLDPDGQSRRFQAWAEQRSRVLPGITGAWQIGGRSDLTFQKMMELDVAYIRNWSLAFDLRILLATPLTVLRAHGAY